MSLMPTVQVELQRRNASGDLVPWRVNDDGAEPASDALTHEKLDALVLLNRRREYIHMQSVPATAWTITHGLGFIPSVTVIRSDGTETFGTVLHLDNNTTQVSFGGAFAGIAYLRGA
jgi:hypothetical protein